MREQEDQLVQQEELEHLANSFKVHNFKGNMLLYSN